VLLNHATFVATVLEKNSEEDRIALTWRNVRRIDRRGSSVREPAIEPLVGAGVDRPASRVDVDPSQFNKVEHSHVTQRLGLVLESSLNRMRGLLVDRPALATLVARRRPGKPSGQRIDAVPTPDR
jgi:hypothetical protein